MPLNGPPLDIGPRAHTLVSVVRNERLRLPHWLRYYRKLGFEHFLLVDNGSDDGTREWLLTQPGVCVFGADTGFGATGLGMAWVNALLDAHCDGRWVLLADADELLVWPGGDAGKIAALTARLERAGAGALATLLLDMYSDRPFGQIGYREDAPFLDHGPFFDRGPYQVVRAGLYPFHQIYGGVRARVFRALTATEFHPPTVSKVPLVRWERGQRFALVAHGLAQPVPLARMRGALLHFKMFDDLPEKCRLDGQRAELFAGGREYRALARAIEQAPGGTFFDKQVSARYTGPKQLVTLGLMSERDPFAV